MHIKYFIQSVAVCTVCAGSPIKAAEHEIIVLGSSFFPTVSYVDAGDTVKFINESETAQTITAIGNTWNTGAIEPASEIVLLVNPAMEGTFFGDAEQLTEGALSFGTPPLDD